MSPSPALQDILTFGIMIFINASVCILSFCAVRLIVLFASRILDAFAGLKGPDQYDYNMAFRFC